jgi:flagellar hook-length control protein FliK
VPRPVPVAAQLGPHLRVLRQGPDGTHHATLVLDPEELGPVRIRMELAAGTIHLHLTGGHDVAVDALREAMPELRQELVDAGLTVGGLDVSAGTDLGGGSPYGASRGPAPGEATAPGTDPPTGDDPVHAARAAPQPHSPTRPGGVDVLA